MKHLFIVNPAAGGTDRTEEIKALAQKSFETREDDFEVYTTKAPGDATDEVIRRADTGEQVRV